MIFWWIWWSLVLWWYCSYFDMLYFFAFMNLEIAMECNALYCLSCLLLLLLLLFKNLYINKILEPFFYRKKWFYLRKTTSCIIDMKEPKALQRECTRRYNNSKNVAIESLFVKPNVRDQSNKELAKFANNLFLLLFALLNVCRLHSL